MRKRHAGLLAGSFSRLSGLILPLIATLVCGCANLPAALVQGVAVEYASGRPLARAAITLSSGRAAQRTVLADSQGHFAFSGLTPGAYQLAGSKKGYAPSRFGQTSWKGPGTAIVLGDESQFTAELRFRHLGVITGQISDENGVGLPEYPVYAYRASQRLRVAAMGQTDDLGHFRLSGLEPGRYYVRSGALELEGRRGLLPTYFGQAMRMAEARAVVADLDKETASGTIEPAAGKLSVLLVRIQAPAGAQVKVTLYTDMGKRDAQTGAGGAVKFDQLPQGSYELSAEAATGAGLWAAYRQVMVGRDEEDMALELQPAPELRVSCGERSGRALPLASIGIFLRRPQYAEDGGSQRISCGDQIPLAPGEWELGALPPPGYYLAEATNLQRGPEGFRLQLPARHTVEARLWFSSDAATLKGRVVTTDGAPAIGAPVFVRGVGEELQNRLGGVRVSRTNDTGEFEVFGLPPGEYEAASTFEAQDTSEILWTPGWGTAVSLETGKVGDVRLTLRRGAD